MTLVGVVTVYTAADFGGQPLYCDRWYNDLRYSETTGPWVAVDVARMQSGEFRCGDWVVIYGDGWRVLARVYDTGYFDEYCVWVDGVGCDRIIADIPAHLAPFDGLSARASMVNISALWRKHERT